MFRFEKKNLLAFSFRCNLTLDIGMKNANLFESRISYSLINMPHPEEVTQKSFILEGADE